MQTITSVAQLRALHRQWQQADRRVAFVPTMGNLHAGHLRLLDVARRQADVVVVSIFVNPMQFGPHEDYAGYPRSMAQDQLALQSAATDVLFVPERQVMYPHGDQITSYVEVPGLTEILEGAHRPTHFRGVSTVVAKLFNLLQPHVAVFGEKDFQQLLVIRKMVQDLNFPIEIIGVPTVREADGLALSSRNGYLSVAERGLAPLLYKTLSRVGEQLKAGSRDFAALEQQAAQQLTSGGFIPDYVAIRQAQSLAIPDAPDDPLVVLGAARLGRTRLIDNVQV